MKPQEVIRACRIRKTTGLISYTIRAPFSYTIQHSTLMYNKETPKPLALPMLFLDTTVRLLLQEICPNLVDESFKETPSHIFYPLTRFVWLVGAPIMNQGAALCLPQPVQP